MRLKNILIVVKDIEKAKQFYHDLFGMEVLCANEGNLILTGGLVLQDERLWREFLKQDILFRHNASELYFEEKELEVFAEKLERLYPDIQYVNKWMVCEWGQKMIQFYDLDGNLLEIRTPIE